MALRDQGPRDIDVTNHAMHVTDGTTFITTAEQTSLASSLGDTSADLGKTYFNYQTKQDLLWAGTVLEFIVTGENGSTRVYPFGGSGNLSRNRAIVAFDGTYVAATHGVMWPSGSDITHLTFIASLHDAGVSAVGDERVVVTIDASNDTEAAGNLGASGDPPSGAMTNANYVVIPLNTPISLPLTNALVNGAAGGGRVDARAIGGQLLDLWIGAN